LARKSGESTAFTAPNFRKENPPNAFTRQAQLCVTSGPAKNTKMFFAPIDAFLNRY
jgi:hypothetical protein